MKKLILLFLFALSTIAVFPQSGSGWDWTLTTGTADPQPAKSVVDITTDAAGKVYGTGIYKGTLTFGSNTITSSNSGNNQDAFIAAFDAAGNNLWLKSFGGDNTLERGQIITVDNGGNIYVGGSGVNIYTNNSAFLNKYDANGNLIWSKTDLPLFEIGGIALAADGNIVAMESTQTAKNIYKISQANGSIIWTVQNTNAGSNAGTTYKDFTDKDGNIYYTCFTTSATTATLAGQDLTTTGVATFVASLDKDGNKRWIQQIDNIQVQLGYTTDNNGNSYIVFSGGAGGSFQGVSTASPLGNRYFELDNTGTVTSYALLSPYLATKIMFRIKGNSVYSYAMQQGTSAAGAFSYGDYFYTVPATPGFALGMVVKYNKADGGVSWANSFEITGTSYNSGSATCMETTTGGKVIVAGTYGTSAKFGANTYATSNPANYATDLFLSQFEEDGLDVPPIPFTWTGAAGDGDWNNAANWDNGVPDGSKKVVIPSGAANYPTTIPTNATGGKIEIASGASIKLPLSFSAPFGIINNGTIEIEESSSGSFLGTFTNNVRPAGTGKMVFKNSNTTIYLTQPLDQSVEINSSTSVPSYGGTINGDLILTNGILNIPFAIYPFLVNGNITGGSASSYVAGTLNRKVTAGGSYDFPVGTPDRYAPVKLILNNISGPQTISAVFTKTIGGAAPNTTAGGQPVTQLLNAGIWTITPDAALTSGSYTVTLEAHGYTNGADDPARYVVVKRPNSSGAWAFYGDNGTSAESGGTVTATAGNITGFSDFAIGIANGIVNATLPVKYISFNAVKQNNAVLLSWQTATETGNKEFVVERCADGQTFTAIGKVKGKGTTRATSVYSYRDDTPLNGAGYYRLKQVNTDGKYEYSEVRSILFTSGGNEGTIKLYPNPATTHFNIAGNRQPIKTIQLFDLSGRKVTDILYHSVQIAIPQSLKKGIYLLKIHYSDGSCSGHQLIIK